MIAPQKKRSLILHISLAIIFLAVIVFASVKYAPSLTKLVSLPEKFKEFLTGYGALGALIYISLQALQIIIVVIPGEIVQLAGGYVFGTALGALFSTAGAVLGTAAVFVATRLLGYPLVKAFVPAATFKKFEFLINNPKSEAAMFLLFLIPGIPKDMLVYIAGLTPIRPLRFLLISTIARFPGLLGSAFIGSHLQKKSYGPFFIMMGISIVLFVVGVLFRDKIIDALHRFRRRRGED